MGLGFTGEMLYFEGHGDLVSRLIVGIIAIITWLVRVVNLLSPHDPPKTLNPKPFGSWLPPAWEFTMRRSAKLAKGSLEAFQTSGLGFRVQGLVGNMGIHYTGVISGFYSLVPC